MELSIAFQTNKTAAEYVALAKLVDQYNFDAVTVYNDAPFHPAYSVLLVMAPHITRARIGPATVQPARIHPIDIAAQAALLESIAPGRTYIGISRGAWLQSHGITPEQKPLTAIRDAVNIVKYMLSGGTGGYNGEMYALAEHVRAPYPLPEKVPAILIGTWGPKLAKIAGEIADEVKIGGSANPDFIPVMHDYIGNPDVSVVIGAVCVVDDDREQARALARQEVALYLPVVAALDTTVEVEPELAARIQSHVEVGESDKAGALISDDLLDRFAFSGSPADLIAQCEALRDAGANRVELGTPHGLKSEQGIKLLGEKVLPALR
ncbi:MAG: LLM class flavin-dependent oxidoreductase [Chloroflexota bacterium]